jgi:hypothetical protein
MSQAGFEPTIPVFEGVKTVHVLDRAATVIGPYISRPSIRNVNFNLWPNHSYVQEFAWPLRFEYRK